MRLPYMFTGEAVTKLHVCQNSELYTKKGELILKEKDPVNQNFQSHVDNYEKISGNPKMTDILQNK